MPVALASSTPAAGSGGLLDAVTTALTTVIDWIGTTVTALLSGGALDALLPLFAIGIAISAFLLGMKAIRSVVWGA